MANQYATSFMVYLSDGLTRRFDDPEAEWEIQDSGVLEVKPSSNAEPVYFSPAGWLRIEPVESYDRGPSLH